MQRNALQPSQLGNRKCTVDRGFDLNKLVKSKKVFSFAKKSFGSRSKFGL